MKRRRRRNAGRCPVCGGPGWGVGEICMACVRSRAKAAGSGRCGCGRKKIEGAIVRVSPRGRAWVPCRRCLGTVRQVNGRRRNPHPGGRIAKRAVRVYGKAPFKWVGYTREGSRGSHPKLHPWAWRYRKSKGRRIGPQGGHPTRGRVRPLWTTLVHRTLLGPVSKRLARRRKVRR